MSTPSNQNPPPASSSTRSGDLERYQYNATEQLVASIKQLNELFAGFAKQFAAGQVGTGSAAQAQANIDAMAAKQPSAQYVSPKQALDAVGGDINEDFFAKEQIAREAEARGEAFAAPTMPTATPGPAPPPVPQYAFAAGKRKNAVGKTESGPVNVGLRERFRQAREGNFPEDMELPEGVQRETGLKAFFQPTYNPTPPGVVSQATSVGIAGSTKLNQQPSPIAGLSQEGYNTALAEGMKIPQFGEWQLDDKLQYARDMALRYQNSITQRGGGPTAQVGTAASADYTPAVGQPGQADYQAQVGTAASEDFTAATGGSAGYKAATAAGNTLQYAYQNAANLSVLGRTANRFGLNPEDFQNLGASLGYNPNDAFGGGSGLLHDLGARTILGLPNPLSWIPGLGSSATQIGTQSWIDSMRLTLHPGVSHAAGQQIMQNMAAEGFSPNESWQYANKVAAPLVQQGMTPEVASQFVNFTRIGATSIQSLGDSLQNFGQIARTIKEPIDVAAESFMQFATEAQSFGATRAGAISAGTAFSAATGLDPQLLGQAYSNPLYQGVMMSQYGILPSGIAAAAGGTQTQGLMSAVNMAMSATSGLNHPTYQTIDGKRIMVESGQDAQIAQTAQLLGLPPEVVSHLVKKAPQIKAASAAETLMMGAGQSGTESGWKAEYNKFIQKNNGVPLNAAEQNKLITGAGMGKSFISLNDVEAEAKKAGISQKELAKINAEPLSKRYQDLQQQIEKKANINTHPKQKVAVEFTGPAARWFKQNVNQSTLSQNAGGDLTSQDAIAPNQMASSARGH